MIYFRYLLVALPFTLPTLALFGLYYWGRRNGLDRPPVSWLWSGTVGLASGIGNMVFNIFVGTFIFWKLPPWLNEEGKFSPFFTTRIKSMRGHPLAEHFVDMVNTMDPGHFSELDERIPT